MPFWNKKWESLISFPPNKSAPFPSTWACITIEHKGLANVAEDLIAKPCQQ